MITKKKLSYEGPICEVFELQMEAVMLDGSKTFSSKGTELMSNDTEEDF